MKLRKRIAILTIAASVSLFGNGVTNVTALVDQINNTKDVEKKQKLIEKLDIEIAVISKKDLPKAKEIINSKLNK